MTLVFMTLTLSDYKQLELFQHLLLLVGSPFWGASVTLTSASFSAVASTLSTAGAGAFSGAGSTTFFFGGSLFSGFASKLPNRSEHLHQEAAVNRFVVG